MGKLSGVILSVEDIILSHEKVDAKIFAEVTKLIKFLQLKKIPFIVFTNRVLSITVKQVTIPLKDYLQANWGDFDYICANQDPSIPKKPSADSTAYVLKKMGWSPSSVLYIGASENDMKTAVNGNLLFLRATWYANKTDYGFEFDRPSNVAKYIDIFCLREHLWCFTLRDKNFEFYALAPFSTMKPEYTLYSEDAKAAAKQGMGHPDFWVGALVSSLYFSGLHLRVDYITTYPGHKAGVADNPMKIPMQIFGKCFRTPSIPDMVVRHTTAVKSQKARQTGVAIDILNQLNTININPNPFKSDAARYARSPLSAGKTVLLIDDICTEGNSLIAGKTFIEQTGANVICVSWLKTINRDIKTIEPFAIKAFNPYIPQKFSKFTAGKSYGYGENITDNLAPGELTKIFQEYDRWAWPKGL
jgi:hypothetical protein